MKRTTMNEPKMDNAATDNELAAGERCSQSQAKRNWNIGLRFERERLARDRRRNLIIVAAVAVVALLLWLFVIWKLAQFTAQTEADHRGGRQRQGGQSRKGKQLRRRSQPWARSSRASRRRLPQRSARRSKQMALLKNKLVKAGEVIAVLESRDLVAQRNEAVAALNQERANERSVVYRNDSANERARSKSTARRAAKVATTRATYDGGRSLSKGRHFEERSGSLATGFDHR